MTNSIVKATHRAVAGTNGELDGRTVRISEQTRNVMQSGESFISRESQF